MQVLVESLEISHLQDPQKLNTNPWRYPISKIPEIQTNCLVTETRYTATCLVTQSATLLACIKTLQKNPKSPIKCLPKDFPIEKPTPLKQSKFDFDPSKP